MTDDFISWKPEYSVDIEAIDRQHMALVNLIRQLQEAMWEWRGRAFQKTVIDRLVKYVEVHFSFEEDMLRERGYESLAEHIEEHRILKLQVADLLARVHEGQAISNTSLMSLLRHWLTDHILLHDHKYARAFKGIT